MATGTVGGSSVEVGRGVTVGGVVIVELGRCVAVFCGAIERTSVVSSTACTSWVTRSVCSTTAGSSVELDAGKTRVGVLLPKILQAAKSAISTMAKSINKVLEIRGRTRA